MQVVNLTPIVGLPQFDGWSQVTIDPSKEFVCAFAVSGSNAGNVGRDLVDFLDQVKPNSAIELHQLFQQIVDQVNQKGCRVSLVAGVFVEQVCYLGTYQASICLKRHEKVGQLVSSDENIKIIEGQIRLGDVFVLVTDQGRSFLEEIQQKLIQGFDVDTIITSVVPSLHNSSNSSLSAVAFGIISDRLSPTTTDKDNNQTDLAPLSNLMDSELTPESAEVSTSTDELSAENFHDQPESNLELVETELASPPLVPEDNVTDPEISNTVPYDPILTYSGSPIKKVSLYQQIFHQIKKIPLLSMIKRFLKLVWQSLIRAKNLVVGLTSRDVYVNQPDKRKVTRFLLLGLVILSLLLGTFGFYFYRVKQQQQQAQVDLQPLEAKLAQAKNLVTTDPIAARQQTEQVILEMQTLTASLAKQKSAQKLALAKLDEAKQFYDSISGREEFQELPTFYDLRLAKPNFIASKVIFVSPNAYFLDSGLSEIITLNTTNKEVSNLTLKSDFAIKDMTLVGKNLILIGNGLYKVKVGDTEVTKIKDADEVTKEPGFISSFGDFIYVLSPTKKNIYRYEQTDGKYGDPKGWLKIQPDINFSQILSWVIDGDVWMTNAEGKVYRFRTGKMSSFSMIGLPEDFASSLMVFSNADSKNIYLLEAKKHRLVVLDKEGKFVKEIKSGSLASATNLIVDEAAGKAYVVSGSLVFAVGI